MCARISRPSGIRKASSASTLPGWTDVALWRERLAHSLTRRAPLAADPATTAYRLVHGIADGIEGVTVDRYGSVLVVSLYGELTVGPRAALLAALAELPEVRAIYCKQRPPEAAHLTEAELAHLAPAEPAWGVPLAEIEILENGLRYLIRPGAGLSVGLFLDMREMRARVRAWAMGRTVLNTFAYTCAFGVAACAGGAARVLNLDLSKPALAWGQANYRANGFAPDPYDFVYGDAFDWLARFARRGQRFNLVILDPPGFARAGGRPFSAARDYARLVALAARVVSPDGLLLACCNVATLPLRAFRRQVVDGIAAAGRSGARVGSFTEPTLDFPTPPGASPYLKLLVFRIQ